MADPTLTLIIPTFSDSRHVTRIPIIRRLFISLKNQINSDFKVVVCDNASYDDTESLFREFFPDQKFVRYDVPNHRSGCRNRAAREVETSHAIFLDCDMITYPTYIRNFKIFIQRHPEAIGIGNGTAYWDKLRLGTELISVVDGVEKIDYDEIESTVILSECWLGGPHQSELRFRNEKAFDYRGHTGKEFWSGNFCIPIELYRKVGGFDEEFRGWGHEDSMFGHVIHHHKANRFILNNVLCIHQMHRPVEADPIHWRDCASATENLKILNRKIKDFE
jgi:GT2 family glycosyltransferase